MNKKQEVDYLKNLLVNLSKDEISKVISSLPYEYIDVLSHDWLLYAREKQLPPQGDWFIWFIRSGRGWGKTRTGAEAVRMAKEKAKIIHFVGRTAADVRDVMVEGESGILNISPKHDRPKYEPSKRRLTWKNGSIALLFSSEEPDMLRGPQCHYAWGDEVSSWKYPEAFDNLELGCRLGTDPRIIITTTPKPNKLTRTILKRKDVYITDGSTYENKDNLADKFIETILNKYDGTRLGKQEIYGELLDDIEGALWTVGLIDNIRIHPEIQRSVLAIDPAVTSNKNSDETGIIHAGLGTDRKAYVINDISGIYSPNEWVNLVVNYYHQNMINEIIIETNQGGDMLRSMINNVDRSIRIKQVRATTGKVTRAEPVVALYEQGMVKHVGSHVKLEEQMITWDAKGGEKSPDRIDALVYAITDLLVNKKSNIYRI